MRASDWLKLMLSECATFLLFTPSAAFCIRTISYYNATEQILRQYAQPLAETN
jgi:hypothetical protein